MTAGYGHLLRRPRQRFGKSQGVALGPEIGLRRGVDQYRQIKRSQALALERRAVRFQEDEGFQRERIVRFPAWRHLGPRAVGGYAIAGSDIVGMIMAIGRQVRQIDRCTRDDERHRAAEREARHADPVGVGVFGKARIRQYRIERLVNVSRPIDERLPGCGMERRDNDETLPREVKQKIAMTQRRARAPAAAV